MNEKSVSINNVSYQIEETVILEGISFDIYSEEILFIIGPNGAGKSTLIKIILGLENPTKGTVRILGKKNVPKTVAKYCGYVSQRFDFDRSFPISVEELIDLNTDGKSEREKILDALRHVKAKNLLDKSVSELSGGELQKVLIARALAADPKILFLDEPTNNLDVTSQQELFELINELKEKHKLAVIVVSHDINVVSENADRVICLNRVIGCTGSPTKVLSKEVLESVYGRGLGFYGHH